MKKWFRRALLCLTLCLSLSTYAFASEYGEITYMKDIVSPEGEDALIVTTVTATTDAEGKLAYPINSDTEITNIEVTTGTVVGDWTEASEGELNYYVIQFAEKEAEVSMTVTSRQTGTYALSDADLDATAVGGLKTLDYTMNNTTPIKIASYDVALAVPTGWELVSISGYSAKEGFDIYNEDGNTFGLKNVGSVDAGNSHSMSINTRQPWSTFRIVLIVVAIAASALFLYKDRGLIKLSVERRAEEKEHKAAEKARNAAEKAAARAAKKRT